MSEVPEALQLNCATAVVFHVAGVSGSRWCQINCGLTDDVADRVLLLTAYVKASY
jgi:hypothetical protein